MDGEIGVESSPGKGSLFWFTASFNNVHDNNDMLPERRVQAEDDEFTAGALRSIDPAEVRLLLAEDSKANQVIARALLERAGYRVDVVSNGQEAIEAVKKFPYALVLMDVRMPEIDGIQATRAIRRLPEDTAQLPILALTASVIKSDLDNCLQAGMNDYITKPIDRKILLEKIAHWLIQGECAKLHSDQTGTMKNGGTLLDIGILQQLEDDTSAQALIGILAIFYRETRERLDRLGADEMLAAAELETEAHTLKSSA
ncbi:MAG: response regulator, partial [Phycisphaerae bacterium]|nr:response regulator [Phycisphaerae bacterium]NIU11825.1 response regulator [Phycisphaerae bacterium]NIX01942.1 response regulator [Phycisphaerae bacterium]